MAESRGLIVPGVTPVIEASIGNAGAGMVFCANALGFNRPQPPTVVAPADISAGRRRQLVELGAGLVESPAAAYSSGYVRVLEEKGGSIGKNPNRLFAMTKIMPEARRAFDALVEEAAAQLRSQFAVEAVQEFIGAVGSGTSISGIGASVKRRWHAAVIAAEPESAPVAKTLRTTNKPLVLESNPQSIHGVGTFGIPADKLNLDFTAIDEFETFATDEAERARSLVELMDDLPVGRSTGGVIAVAARRSRTLRGNILMCVYDTIQKSR
jgi:cysteine synthase